MESTIKNLSNDLYHNGEEYADYLSSSQLKHYLVSPKWAKFIADNPDEAAISAEAAEIGSLYHSAMEHLANGGSVDGWRKKFKEFVPPVNPKTGEAYGASTKAYKQAIAEQTTDAISEGFELGDPAKLDLICSMVTALLDDCGETSKTVRKFLKWGTPEVSHFVEHKGAKFKYRPDIETLKKIIDWKSLSVADLHPSTISKTITKFGYHISAAFYQYFEHERSGIWKDFYWVFQQKSAPYDAVVIDASPWGFRWHEDATMPDGGYLDLGLGAQTFLRLLDLHLKCVAEENYPGAEIFFAPDKFGRRIAKVEPAPWEHLPEFVI